MEITNCYSYACVNEIQDLGFYKTVKILDFALWVMTPYSDLVGYQLHAEDGGSMVLRNHITTRCHNLEKFNLCGGMINLHTNSVRFFFILRLRK